MRVAATDWIVTLGRWPSNVLDWLTAERLTAIGTVGATAFAAAAAWSGVRERRRAGKQARRMQARRVSIGTPQARGRSVEGIGRSSVILVNYQVEVWNDSDEVITDCTAILTARYLPKVERSIGNIDLTFNARQTVREDRVLPGQHLPFAQVGWRMRLDSETQDVILHWIDAEVEFTDAAGIRWRRDRRHLLWEVKSRTIEALIHDSKPQT